MAIFGFGKDKKDEGGASETVLAWLEDAQRVRAPFILIGPKKTELPATLQSVDEGEGLATFQVGGPLVADKGSKINFVFIQEGLRIGGTARIVELRSNAVVVELPEALELNERRKAPRARLNPKEGATVTALTGLFEGVGITGIVENISEQGARVRVEKAMSLKGEKKLPLGVALVPPGQPFMLIKLNKLPKCPSVMEMEGKAVYLDASAGGLVMGLAFDKPRPDLAGALRNLVASRTTAIPTTLPAKARRKPEALREEEELVRPAAAPRTPAAPPPAPEPAAPERPAPAAVAAPAAPPPTPAAKAVEEAEAPKNDALVRLKKRSRAVVALAPSAAYGDLFKDYLQEEGYGRVLVASRLEELLEHLQQPNLALLFLDGGFGTMESLELVTKLKGQFEHLPPIVLAAEDVSMAIVLAARRAGVTQMVVKPYAFDEALSGVLMQQMGF